MLLDEAEGGCDAVDVDGALVRRVSEAATILRTYTSGRQRG